MAVAIVDGGTSTDPNDLAGQVKSTGADFVALSSYNGVALPFVTELKQDLKKLGVSALEKFVDWYIGRMRAFMGGHPVACAPQRLSA